jgi:hypothetical protein
MIADMFMQIKTLNRAFLILTLFNVVLWLNPLASNSDKTTKIDVRQASQQSVCSQNLQASRHVPASSFYVTGLNLGLTVSAVAQVKTPKSSSKFISALHEDYNTAQLSTISNHNLLQAKTKPLIFGFSLRGPPQNI